MQDPKAYPRRPRKIIFVLLYSSPDENSGVPKRVVVKPDSKVDFLTVEADVDMKQLDSSTSPSAPTIQLKIGCKSNSPQTQSVVAGAR
jgi:hypothetical protein